MNKKQSTTSAWQSVETAPRDGTHFLGYWKAPLADRPEIIIARWNNDIPWIGFYGLNVQDLQGCGSISTLSGGWSDELYLTHWMPLPEPPKVIV